MPVDVSALRMHLEYSAWASGRLLETAGTLEVDELTRDFRTADRNVVGTLAHVFAADRVWLGRLVGNPPAKFLDPGRDVRISTLQKEWPDLQRRWQEWISGQTDESVQAPLGYKDLQGNPYSTPPWQIVMHVVNHATHHRGQVSGMLRAMGHVPPSLDLIRYVRTVAAQAGG